MGCPPINKTLPSIVAETDDDLILVTDSLRTLDLIADKYVDVVILTLLGLFFISLETCAFVVILKRERFRYVCIYFLPLAFIEILT